MKIPQGYKQTELGIIPEEWEVVKLGNLGVTYTRTIWQKEMRFWLGFCQIYTVLEYS